MVIVRLNKLNFKSKIYPNNTYIYVYIYVNVLKLQYLNEK